MEPLFESIVQGNLMTFEERSRKVAERFLQTAVVVDDNAYSRPEEEPSDLIEPTPGSAGNVSKEELSKPAQRPQGTFNAEDISNAFVELGIFALVLKPTLEKRISTPAYLDAIKKADLAILDWKLVGEENDGEQTLDILKAVFPSSDGDRSRLVAIYTAGTELETVASTVVGALDSFQRNDFTLSRGHSRIVIYAKEGIQKEGEDNPRVVKESSLPAKLVADFSEATRGLLSNVALEGLARLRENTHLLLSRFSSDLDAPYVAHRLLTTPPSEAADHIHPLIADEIAAALDEGGISELLNDQCILDYLSSRKECNHLDLAQLGTDADKAWQYLASIVRTGLEGFTGEDDLHRVLVKDGKFKKDQYEKLSKVVGAVDSTPSADERFSMLLSLYGSYTPYEPRLTPGVVLQEGEGDNAKYWLCIQPACDCVRLTVNRKFIMLNLEKVSDAANFDVVALDKGKSVVRLKVNRRIFDGDMPEFVPDTTLQSVKAVLNDDVWTFESTDSRVFFLMCVLKQAHTHRLVQRSVGDLGRVGLTEHEWARRKGPQA